MMIAYSFIDLKIHFAIISVEFHFVSILLCTSCTFKVNKIVFVTFKFTQHQS